MSKARLNNKRGDSARRITYDSPNPCDPPPAQRVRRRVRVRASLIMSPFQDITRSEAFRKIVSRLSEGERTIARGASGSSTIALVAELTRSPAHPLTRSQPILLVVGHIDEADEADDQFSSWGVESRIFPALEVLPGETGVNVELLAERLRLVRDLDEGGRDRPRSPDHAPAIIVAPIQALMQSVPEPGELERFMKTVRTGDSVNPSALLEWLDRAGYRRTDAVDSPGDFSMRGGIIDIFSPGETLPARLDFFGDEVETIREIDLETMGSDRKIEQVTLIAMNTENAQSDSGVRSMVEALPKGTIAIYSEVIEIHEQGRGYYERLSDARGIEPHQDVLKRLEARCHATCEISHYTGAARDEDAIDLPVDALPAFAEETGAAIGELLDLSRERTTRVFCQNEGERERLSELLAESDHGPGDLEIITAYLHRGFIWDDLAAYVPYHELVHRYHTRRRVRRIATSRAIDSFLDIEPGDLVVHRDHGIAKFLNFGPLSDRDGEKTGNEEFLTLEFSGGTKLHVPASQIAAVQKYVGGFAGRPKLSTIGGRTWKNQKAQVSDAVRDLAAEMLRLQAARETLPGVRYPADTKWQKEFEAEFPYEETEDQLAAITALKRDMVSEKPMDRLICGDVGFGKTEVAIRAAFKAAEYGKQVAVLVPTTVLAEQHEQTFRGRFADYPFNIESISRFKTKKEQNEVLRLVQHGQIDIIIGTHRLLSKDVKFNDLGLVIVDEEQRFGVEHKNRLLEFRATVDVLTLSATPIPRTLHMSMLGLRDISSLARPPADRRSIVTEVIPSDNRRIKRAAIERELGRDGQVFFVHNRVHNIESVADQVRQLVPGARIVIGHGQMSARELEKVMLAFMRREADILVSTTIIESGIDIPTANTMIINDADMFGLSELHQLRGRVGRYKHRAYCYLVLPNDRTLNEKAVRRLKAIEDYSMLGAGFRIAMRDLEIRGAGNLLGAEQSGHISAVGYEMYCELLQNAVEELKEGRVRPRASCVVDLGISGALSKRYIPADVRRIEAYRRLSNATTLEELERVERDLTTAYGDPPQRAQPLFELAAIRIAAAEIGVKSIRRHEGDIIFKTNDPTALGARMEGASGSLRLVGQPDDSGFTDIYYRPPGAFLEDATLLNVLRRRLTGAGVSEPVRV